MIEVKAYAGSSWLGPVFHLWGTSPYLDWYLETHYLHARAWWQ